MADEDMAEVLARLHKLGLISQDSKVRKGRLPPRRAGARLAPPHPSAPSWRIRRVPGRHSLMRACAHAHASARAAQRALRSSLAQVRPSASACLRTLLTVSALLRALPRAPGRLDQCRRRTRALQSARPGARYSPARARPIRTRLTWSTCTAPRRWSWRSTTTTLRT